MAKRELEAGPPREQFIHLVLAIGKNYTTELLSQSRVAFDGLILEAETVDSKAERITERVFLWQEMKRLAESRLGPPESWDELGPMTTAIEEDGTRIETRWPKERSIVWQKYGRLLERAEAELEALEPSAKDAKPLTIFSNLTIPQLAVIGKALTTIDNQETNTNIANHLARLSGKSAQKIRQMLSERGHSKGDIKTARESLQSLLSKLPE